MSDSPLYGLVLSGGRSERMGTDKSILSFHGKPQREFMFELLIKFCAKVYISCQRDHTIPGEFNPLPDQFEMKSPLSGILTAFQVHPAVAWITAPVDMPYIDESAIRFLLANRKPEKYATCFFDSDGKDPEPLFAIWEPRAAPALAAFYKNGGIGARGFLKTHDVAIIQPPDKKLHLNINTPEDFDRFLKEHRG